MEQHVVASLPVRLVQVRTSDRVLLHGAVAGPDTSIEGILAIHGAWGNYYTSPTAEFLRAGPSRGLQVLALNTRFHDLATLGDGEPCVGFVNHRFPQSLPDLYAAQTLLQSLGVKRYLVVAHSYGGHLASFWLAQGGGAGASGLVLAGGAPPLGRVARWFVEGELEEHVAMAASAVAAGEPDRLVVLSHRGVVPMVAEAATVLETWGPDAITDSSLHLPSVRVPVLVLTGALEPAPYRRYARETADAAPEGDLITLNDDHYFSQDREGFAKAILDWAASGGLLSMV